MSRWCRQRLKGRWRAWRRVWGDSRPWGVSPPLSRARRRPSRDIFGALCGFLLCTSVLCVHASCYSTLESFGDAVLCSEQAHFKNVFGAVESHTDGTTATGSSFCLRCTFQNVSSSHRAAVTRLFIGGGVGFMCLVHHSTHRTGTYAVGTKARVGAGDAWGTTGVWKRDDRDAQRPREAGIIIWRPLPRYFVFNRKQNGMLSQPTLRFAVCCFRSNGGEPQPGSWGNRGQVMSLS